MSCWDVPSHQQMVCCGGGVILNRFYDIVFSVSIGNAPQGFLFHEETDKITIVKSEKCINPLRATLVPCILEGLKCKCTLGD